jgi:hypothetical protein
MNIKELDKSKIIEILKEKQTKNFVITPIKILKTLGFPVAEHQFIIENKLLISNLKLIFKELEKEGLLIERKSKQDFKGIKETAYDYITKV